MKSRNSLIAAACLLAGVNVSTLQAQKDPGPRSGKPDAGTYYSQLGPNEQNLFTQALQRFQEVNSVSGAIEDGNGLGPAFNGNSCAMCHSQPAIGGSSPGLKSPQNSVPNPQVALASLDGATNKVPAFISIDGPIREARFVRTQEGKADGGVHGLYSIAGRTDAVGCNLPQPDFATELLRNNVVFRIPTPLFGLGLVENTPDSTLQANLAATRLARDALGIGGRFNRNGNDGTITKFGWKAQNKSLRIFAGEAYNVEQGVSNEMFPNERSAVPGCVFNSTPEDSNNMLNGNPSSPNFNTTVGTVSEMLSDSDNFAAFMQLLGPAAPASPTTSTQTGGLLFTKVGCALCHSPSLVTAQSIFTVMGGVTYHPYSDFALHRMGERLEDGVTQGLAGSDEFRTAPLWGLGQRLFFMHDGRTSDLLEAIRHHAGDRSEANQVIGRFYRLSDKEKQDLLNFLRSL